MTDSPLWRQAYDAVDKAVTPRAENLVRTPGFALAAALTRRAQVTAQGAARGLTARAWHLVNLPAASDIGRLRAQVGALDREVRRLTVALESERRRSASPATSSPTTTTARSTEEDPGADSAQPAAGTRARPARRRTQRPASS